MLYNKAFFIIAGLTVEPNWLNFILEPMGTPGVSRRALYLLCYLMTEDEIVAETNKEMNTLLPFAVVGSNEFVKVGSRSTFVS